MTITLIDSQTQSATFVGTGLSVASITGAWTIKLDLQSLTASDGSTPTARFEFDDTVNSFTASVAGPTASFKGTYGVSFDRVHSWKQQDFPDLRLGTANAQLRLQLTQISANATAQYRAWLEY